MKNKFSGFYWDKESKKPASAEKINAKIEEAKDPSITFKLSELENLNVDTLKKKLEESSGEFTKRRRKAPSFRYGDIRRYLTVRYC